MILFLFVFFSSVITFGTIFIGLLIWLYRKYLRKEQNLELSDLFTFSPVSLPTHFNWAVGILILGFHLTMYNYLTQNSSITRTPALGLALMSITLASAWMILLKKKTLLIYTLITTVALTGIGTYVRANGFVQYWNCMYSLISNYILYIIFISDHIPHTIGDWLNSIISILPRYVTQTVQVIRSLFTSEQTSKNSIFRILKTFIITLIVLTIFLTLLSQADPIFEKIVRDFREQLVGRSLWTIVIIFIAAIWLTIRHPKPNTSQTSITWLSQADIISAVSVVLISVGIFLIVQYQYLFAGNRELLITYDITFSEYVRKGFVELLLAVLIGGIISYIASAKSFFLEGTQQKIVSILNNLMLGELVLLLISALKRNLLYIDTYGLTRVRVIGTVFLIWLTIFIIVLSLYAWRRLKEQQSILYLWIASLFVMLSLNIWNTDSYLTNSAPGHHEYTDYFYLSQLSEDNATNYQTVLNKISNDTQVLIQNATLSEEQTYQLAGLKLALISLIEKHDNLMLKYASDEWLLNNYRTIGLNLPDENSEDTSYNWDQNTPVIETNFPTQHEKSITYKEKYIPQSLRHYRAWTNYNLSEKKAYEIMAQHQSTYLPELKNNLYQILKYQNLHQLSLFKQENFLLTELKYPFISVQLKRYYAQDGFETKNITMATLREYQSEAITQSSQKHTTVEQLICTPDSQYTTLSKITRTDNVITNNSKKYELTSVYADQSGKVSILVPQTLTMKINNTYIEYPHEYRQENSYYDDGQSAIATIQLDTQMTTDTCQFIAKDITIWKLY